MSQTESQDQAPVFQLKGSMLAITVLELAQNNLEALDRQLAAKVAQAPNFFSNTPLVLALDKLPVGAGAVDLPGLMRVCRQHGLRTLAIRASRIEDIAAAIAIDLPVLPPSGARERPIEPPVEVIIAPKKPENRPNRPSNRPASSPRQYVVAKRYTPRVVTWWSSPRSAPVRNLWPMETSMCTAPCVAERLPDTKATPEREFFASN